MDREMKYWEVADCRLHIIHRSYMLLLIFVLLLRNASLLLCVEEIAMLH